MRRGSGCAVFSQWGSRKDQNRPQALRIARMRVVRTPGRLGADVKAADFMRLQPEGRGRRHVARGRAAGSLLRGTLPESMAAADAGASPPLGGATSGGSIAAAHAGVSPPLGGATSGVNCHRTRWAPPPLGAVTSGSMSGVDAGRRPRWEQQHRWSMTAAHRGTEVASLLGEAPSGVDVCRTRWAPRLMSAAQAGRQSRWPPCAAVVVSLVGQSSLEDAGHGR